MQPSSAWTEHDEAVIVGRARRALLLAVGLTNAETTTPRGVPHEIVVDVPSAERG